MVELGEDLEGAPPAVPGKGERTRFMVVVTQVHQCVPFVEAITDLAIQVDGVPITGYRLLVVTEPLMGVAEAVPGGRLPQVGAVLPMQRKGLLAAVDRLVTILEQSAAPPLKGAAPSPCPRCR